ncbi:uncharacterized protein [Petaurus breviceps papuanus]|uniref:uncharacterized protein isoform X3 n=1 Tax=Petaurus breviceps papuanus TaxID=3040969 RepID=UPI0036DE3E21
MISGEEEEEVTWMDRFGMRKRIFSFKRLFGLKRNNTAVGKEIQNNFGITDKGNQRPVELNIFPAKQPYIPYALAKAYITKNDYSSKIKTLKGRFEAYQEQVNKKNRSWQDTMKILVEKTDELMQEKNKLLLQVNQEKEKWEKEKRWLLEIFAQKLDLLHTHHSVTAQKIKATRLALENIQGILKFPNVQKNENLSSEKVISWIFSNEAEPEFTDAFEKVILFHSLASNPNKLKGH